LGQDIEVIRYFRTQLRAISDAPVLELVEKFGDRSFMNAEVRTIFGSKRQTAWARLARLTEAGMVQKRGHVYRISPFTEKDESEPHEL
jgi:RecB family exonuclease